MIAQPIDEKDNLGSGGRLVAADGRVLPLRGAEVRVDAKAGLARVVLQQCFANVYAEPLVVSYALPLPHDGVVSGYVFSIGDRRIVGEVDRRAAARERYEQALIEGHSAALLEQDRSSLFTQEIGNLPPGVQVVCEISIDQRLRWLEEGLWEWRFPTVVAPRYLGHEGRVPDADRVRQDVADGGSAVPVSLALAIRDALPNGGRPVSPSHAIAATVEGAELHVAFESAAGRLDRDVVVRWPVAHPRIGVTIDTARRQINAAHADTAYGLLTVVPPVSAAASEPFARDLVVLLDTSGSMSGEPLEQARRVVAALIDTLSERDRLELIAFSSTARRWRPAAVAATGPMRREALSWLGELRASGGTEMLDGIVAALQPQRDDAQRQIILVTDGLIGFESEVVSAICEQLPAQSRLHVVGVGSAVNRTLTAGAARAGRGSEVIIGLGEDPDEAAQRLRARTSRPLVVGLEISGSAVLAHAPARLPDLYVGAPALVALQLQPAGGELRVRGSSAREVWEECLQVPPVGASQANPAIAALYARELVEDLEMRRVAQGPAEEIDAQVERIGLEFQVATRLTSWVAISETPTVDPREPVRRERMPQALPYGMSVEGLGLRQPQSPMLEMAIRSAPDIFEQTFSSPPGFVTTPQLRRRQSLSMSAKMLERPHRGRVVSRKARAVVIEFVVDGGLEVDWQPTQDVRVQWDDGTMLRARLDSKQSTRPGVVAVGCTIRVVLAFAADLPGGGVPVRVILRSGVRLLVIEV